MVSHRHSAGAPSDGSLRYMSRKRGLPLCVGTSKRTLAIRQLGMTSGTHQLAYVGARLHSTSSSAIRRLSVADAFSSVRLATRLGTSSSTPSVKVTGTSRPCSALMLSVDTYAEFCQSLGAVPTAVGGTAPDSLGGNRLNFVVSATRLESLRNGSRPMMVASVTGGLERRRSGIRRRTERFGATGRSRLQQPSDRSMSIGLE
jgi:hypothetical protein